MLVTMSQRSGVHAGHDLRGGHVRGSADGRLLGERSVKQSRNNGSSDQKAPAWKVNQEGIPFQWIVVEL